MLQADAVQPVQEILPLLGIGVQQPVVVALGELQPGDGGLLQGGGGPYGEEVVDLFGPLPHLLRADEVAQPPAGNGVGFRQGVAGNGVVKHAGEGGHAGMGPGGVNHVLIDLIGDHKGVVFQGQLSDAQQLLPGEHLAAGIGGVADNDGLGPLLKSLLHQRHIKVVFRRNQGDIDGVGPGENGIRPVILIEGGKYQHLVPRVADGHHGAHHGLSAAAGDDNLGLRVDLPPNGPPLLPGQGLTEVLRSKGDGILMGAGVGRFGQSVHDLLGRVKVRKALGQIDGPVLVADPGHAADDRVGKALHPVA